jgi:phosphatidylglycerophosphate synthase
MDSPNVKSWGFFVFAFANYYCSLPNHHWLTTPACASCLSRKSIHAIFIGSAHMEDNRRPINTRSRDWAKSIAGQLAKRSITPNQISLLSVVFAALGAVSIALGPGTLSALFGVVCIQMRLLCNLFDGMVAVEGGKQSALGSLYNEFPDRVADSLLIIALGYAVNDPTLGYLGALAAALTAYVRVFGGSLGLKQIFKGPMAKQHRMAVMTLALLLDPVETYLYPVHPVYVSYGLHNLLWLGLFVIVVGSFLTCCTRTLAIARQLKEPAHVDQ